MEYLLKGIIIGLAIAAPVGPIGLLCIRRTLAHGRLSGLLSGLGAASADGIYGMIAAFGLTAVSELLLKEKLLLSLIGGSFLCYLGYKTFVSKPANTSAKAVHKGLVNDYLSTLFLTITNPATILAFLAVFASVGLQTEIVSALLLVIGVFMGSALWWLVLSIGVSLVRGNIDSARMVIINKLSGLIIVAFGAMTIMSILNSSIIML